MPNQPEEHTLLYHAVAHRTCRDKSPSTIGSASYYPSPLEAALATAALRTVDGNRIPTTLQYLELFSDVSALPQTMIEQLATRGSLLIGSGGIDTNRHRVHPISNHRVSSQQVAEIQAASNERPEGLAQGIYSFEIFAQLANSEQKGQSQLPSVEFRSQPTYFGNQVEVARFAAVVLKELAFANPNNALDLYVLYSLVSLSPQEQALLQATSLVSPSGQPEVKKTGLLVEAQRLNANDIKTQLEQVWKS